MDFFSWLSIIILLVITAYQNTALKKLKKQSANTIALLNDLLFKHNDSTEFLSKRIAGINYDFLQRSEQLIFHSYTTMEEALSRPGAREVLIQRKMIRKKDKGPFQGNLAERARECKLSLEPVLISLNDIEFKE